MKTRKPNLQYVEYHLVEHCNFKCRGCGHFSQIAPKGFANVSSFSNDLTQLALHFNEITEVALMGGEPLLHPEPSAFIDEAHRILPSSQIYIYTNGSPIKAMSSGFWESCRKANATIRVSFYPKNLKTMGAIKDICAENDVKFMPNQVEKFVRGINPAGDSDPIAAMKYCRSHYTCPFLYEGRLYVCSFPALAKYYNVLFGKNIIKDEGIDIYHPQIDGDKILKRLETPVETCKSCSCKWEKYDWEESRVPREEDYIVSS